jgi:hypothetical protein
VLPELRYTGRKSGGWVTSTGRVRYPVIRKFSSGSSDFLEIPEKNASLSKIGVIYFVFPSSETRYNIQTVDKHEILNHVMKNSADLSKKYKYEVSYYRTVET